MEGETKHIFTWKIENFRLSTQQNGYGLKSPVFMAESLVQTTWYVQLYPDGRQRTTNKFISCYLYRLNDCAGPDKIDCDYIFEALDGNNKSLRKLQSVKTFVKGKGMGWEEFLEKESVLNSNTISFIDILTVRITLKKRLPNFFSQNSGLTKLVTDRFSFKWNFKNSITSSADIKSVSFSEFLQLEITFEIPEDDVEIGIRKKKNFSVSQKLLCGVTLLNLKGEESDFQKAIFEIDDSEYTWKFPNFLKKSKITDEKNKYLEGNYFTLKFDFAFSKGKTFEFMKDIECKFLDNFWKADDEHSASLKADLKRVFTNRVHTDVELHVGKEVILAHKVILCARSPVFSAMFSQDMAENQNGIITITDMEAETLNHLLEYLYTGETDVLTVGSNMKLLMAANKYQVLTLKEKCSSSLKPLVSDENVCEILLTADLIQQESLKVSAVNHIKENSKKIFKSEEWKLLAEKNLKLATETFCEVTTLLSA